MNQKTLVQDLLRWFARNARDLPWRRTRDPYAIWVSEIMLQQTQVKTVLPYWERWMRELPDIPALAGASTEKLHKLWEGLGYYTRVRNLQKAAQLVLEEHGGRFPQDYAQILELPGIGRYTAGAICSIAFNQPQPILDGNAVRVLSRLFGISGDARKAKTRAQLWRLAEELVVCAAGLDGNHKRPASAFNQAIMELGALICTPMQTKCPVCPAAKHCVAHREDRVQELPQMGPRLRATRRHFVAFVLQNRNRLLVQQRPAGVVNAHLWEFPNVELANSLKAGLQTDLPSETLRQVARRVLGRTPASFRPLCTIKHSITRFRITLHAFQVVCHITRRRSPSRGRWVTQQDLRALTFSSAHNRILRHLGIAR
jgi:A/G-specific adenine glycosylase